MKLVKIRCWRVGEGMKDIVTYPESEDGHRLVMCSACCQVHAVSVVKQMYIEPNLAKYMRERSCWKCGRQFGDDWQYYPKHLVDDRGNTLPGESPGRLPGDEESVIVELPDVYS
jgi:hypothetical protein